MYVERLARAIQSEHILIAFLSNKEEEENKEVLLDWKDMKPVEWSFLFISFSEMYHREFIEFVSEEGTKTISLFSFPEERNTKVEKDI
jgi:hypothetical protein